jgi:DNA-binding NarL/FixJ family response regulator
MTPRRRSLQARLDSYAEWKAMIASPEYQERKARMLADVADPPPTAPVPATRQSPPMNPTLGELEILLAYIEYGCGGAATALGLSVSTVKNTLKTLRWRVGAKSTTHAVYILWPVIRGYWDEPRVRDRRRSG